MNFLRRLFNKRLNNSGNADADTTPARTTLPDTPPGYMVNNIASIRFNKKLRAALPSASVTPAGTTLAYTPPTGITPARVNPADTQESLTSSLATQTCHIHHCMSQLVISPLSTSLLI